MKHKIGFNRLGRKASHRKALHRNMATSLFRYERIKTTRAKALAIRRTAEKMITRAKIDSVHNRRIIAKDIQDKEILAKLFTDIGPRFKERPGGYTRILKLGFRQGDAAEMVLLELVKEEQAGKKKKTTKQVKAKKAAAPEKAAKSEKAGAPEKDEEKPVEKDEAVEAVKEEKAEELASAEEAEEKVEVKEAEATDEADSGEEQVAESQAQEEPDEKDVKAEETEKKTE